MITIKISELVVETTIGVYDFEREKKQPVTLNIELDVACNKSCISDDIKDAVDYALIAEEIINHLANSNYFLLEKLVDELGKLILSIDNRIQKIRIEAGKQGVLKQAKMVSVSKKFLRS